MPGNNLENKDMYISVRWKYLQILSATSFTMINIPLSPVQPELRGEAMRKTNTEIMNIYSCCLLGLK